MKAILDASDHSTWFGRRDRVLLLTMLQTALRVSEVIGFRGMGKGRKERATPRRAQNRDALKAWLALCRTEPSNPIFATIPGRPLSRVPVERIVLKHAATAASSSSTFRLKRVTPHLLHQTAAMQLLQSDVDRTIITLWLGHESVEMTQVYFNPDMPRRSNRNATGRADQRRIIQSSA